MSNNGIVNIHGKDYMTVARRVELAHGDQNLEGVETEVLSHQPIVIKAIVRVKGKTFTGISSVNPESAKMIEKDNPYEVAETSAVGRALGFAGYGVIEGIPSADDMVRAVRNVPIHADREVKTLACLTCGAPAVEKEGTTKTGKHYHGIFCTSEERGHTQWL